MHSRQFRGRSPNQLLLLLLVLLVMFLGRREFLPCLWLVDAAAGPAAVAEADPAVRRRQHVGADLHVDGGESLFEDGVVGLEVNQQLRGRRNEFGWNLQCRQQHNTGVVLSITGHAGQVGLHIDTW